MTETPSRPLSADDHLMLVDGSTYIFRAYHALPPLTRKSDGLPVGAVSGFCNMLWKLLHEGDRELLGPPATHLAVIFDHSAYSFRNDIYPDYKAHRPEPPEDLRPQFPVIREAVRAFNVACIEQEGYEADDLIATYTTQAVEAGAKVSIISSDKDLMQLMIHPDVVLVDTMKDRRMGPAEVMEKFGVTPDKMIDLQSLAGDSVDNVPGVPGIGVKTAAQLLDEFGDLETLLAQADTIKQTKRRENLINFADQARVSKRLVTLKTDVPAAEPLESTLVRGLDGEQLIGFLKAMEFTTLTKRVATATDTKSTDVETAAIATPAFEGGKTVETISADGDLTPGALAEARAAELADASIDADSYETIFDPDQLKALFDQARWSGLLAFDTETTSLDPMRAKLVGFSFATEVGKAFYVPLTHTAGDDLLGSGHDDRQMPMEVALPLLKAVLEDPAILKIGQNIKYDMAIMANHDIAVAPFDDTMLLSYVCGAGTGGHGMDELSKKWLGHEPIPYKELVGSGKSMVTFDHVPIDKATRYAAEDADITLRLWRALKPRLIPSKATTVYETLERPLVPVLARMERAGIKVDRQILSRLSGDFAQGMAALEAEIEELAGEPFNVGSPKQLGDILFGKMGLPGGKKTKTGAWGTPASALEDLAAEGHELPRKVLDWRQLQKLRSTYTEALGQAINPDTGRVHTSFALAATSTGRLSSSDPNLQNIPVRTEAGRKIRTAFIAEPGCKLVSADYSQIELRVLAHVADIDALKQAFADGLDIHAMTASEMFGVPIEGMDPLVRRRAKAINFGIIYGISAFGLANQLSIERSEASDYIKTYFERFPGIKQYMDDTKAFCREHGYVETIFGRRAHYPDIKASNPSLRAFNERAAINAPIQGSAADIIRRAMIRMEPALAEAGLNATMLLQVHDELIFEVPESEVEATLPVIEGIMVEAPNPALSLSVPLEVDARAADNWDDAH
ncbi:MAG: DNA polymerase I [Devosiaceae bacterium]|nr:DNA polymerase I [Devosiaceae bacterium MH13]